MLTEIINNSLVINLDDEIGGFFGITDTDLKWAIASLSGAYSNDIFVNINSVGGSVITGMAIRGIFQDLIEQGKSINIRVNGLAGSVASVIALSGSSLAVAQGSYIMIHRPKAGKMVDYEEAESLASMLKKVTDDFVAIYAKSSNLSPEIIAEAMRTETWYTAEESVKNGFANSVLNSEEITASSSVIKYDDKNEIWASFSNIPKAITDHPINRNDVNPLNSSKENFMDLKTAYKEHPELKIEVDALLSAQSPDSDAIAKAVALETTRVTTLTAMTDGKMTAELKAVIDNGGSEADLALAMFKAGKTPVPAEPVAPVSSLNNTAVIPAVAPVATVIPATPEAQASVDAEAKFDALMNSVIPKGE